MWRLVLWEKQPDAQQHYWRYRVPVPLLGCIVRDIRYSSWKGRKKHDVWKRGGVELPTCTVLYRGQQVSRYSTLLLYLYSTAECLWLIWIAEEDIDRLLVQKHWRQKQFVYSLSDCFGWISNIVPCTEHWLSGDIYRVLVPGKRECYQYHN